MNVSTTFGGGGYFTWLLRKHKCLLESNQTADGFRSSPRDLVMRINALPKGTSAPPWFQTRVTGLRDHCSTDWAINCASSSQIVTFKAVFFMWNLCRSETVFFIRSGGQKELRAARPARPGRPVPNDHRSYNAACYYITEPWTKPSLCKKLLNSAEPNRTRTWRLAYSTNMTGPFPLTCQDTLLISSLWYTPMTHLAYPCQPFAQLYHCPCVLNFT